MNIQFKTLLTLGGQHEYFAGGPCPDLSFVVPGDTARLLRRLKLVPKVLNDRWHLLVEADDAGVPFVDAAGATLRVGIRADHPYFANFTKLPFGAGGGVLVVDNRGGSNTALGAPVATVLTGPRLNHPLRTATRPVSVVVTSREGATVLTERVDAGTHTELSLDLREQPAGLYTIGETDAAGATTRSVVYVDGDLVREPLIAIVEIVVAKTFTAAPPALTVAFATISDTLKYTLIVRGYADPEFNGLIVSDEGATGRPKVTFARDLPAQIPPEIGVFEDARIVVFRSSSPVTRLAAGRQRLELRRNSDVLYGSLPQPAADRAGAEFVIHLSKPKP